MSGDSFSDTASSTGVDILSPEVKVSQWLKRLKSRTPSSGYDTMSNASDSQKSQMASVKDDIPLRQNNPVHMNTSKYTRSPREQKHARSASI